MRVRNVRDLLAGCVFLAFGAAFFALSQNYQLGSARQMGPAYFPAVLSLVLIAIGLATVARAFLVAGLPIRDVAGKALAFVTTGVVLFGLIVQGAGLAIATMLLVLVSAFASPHFRPLATILLAVTLAAFCTLVFVVGLGLPFPALGSWFRG